MQDTIYFKFVYLLFSALIAAPVYAGLEPNYTITVNEGVTSTDDNSQTITYENGLGKAVQMQIFQGDKGNRLISCFQYAPEGQVSRIYKSFTENGLFFKYFSDNPEEAANRQYASIPGGQNGYAWEERTYYSDPLSRVKSIGRPGIEFSINESSGHPSRSWFFGVNPNGNEKIDEHGFLLLQELNVLNLDALKLTVNNPKYFLTVSCDPNGHFNQSIKDIWGNVLKEWSSPDGQQTYITQYTYNVLGKPLSSSPLAGSSSLISSYIYDTRGFIIVRKLPDITGLYKYIYNKAAQLVEAIKPDGTRIFYEYDMFDRPTNTGVISETNTKKVKIINYYDYLSNELTNHLSRLGLSESDRLKLGAELEENAIGKLIATIAVDENEINEVADIFIYDPDARIKVKYKLAPSLPLQRSEYEYDRHGKLLKEISTDGTVANVNSYVYGDQGKLKQIWDGEAGSGRLLVEYVYSDIGVLEGKQFHTAEGGLSYEVQNKYNINDWLMQTGQPETCAPSCDQKYGHLQFLARSAGAICLLQRHSLGSTAKNVG